MRFALVSSFSRASRKRSRSAGGLSNVRLCVERLEERLPPCVPGESLEIALDTVFDQFGFQPVAFQAYETSAAFSVFDTGASVITFSASDQMLFELVGGTIPIKVAGGAFAEGIGGTLTGDVSQPGTITADGLHVGSLTFDAQGFPVFQLNFDANSAVVSGVQVFVGTVSGSEALPTITGTPILNPSAQHPAGLAVHIQPEGYLLDFSDFLPGLVVPVPDVRFQDPNSPLEATEVTFAPGHVSDPAPAADAFLGDANLFDLDDFYTGLLLRFTSGALSGQTQAIADYEGITRTLFFSAPFTQAPANGDTFEILRTTTNPVCVALDMIGDDNHLDPGDFITTSPNPVQNHVSVVHNGITLNEQVFLFDTGAQLSILSTAQADALGLDVLNPQTSISVYGAAGVVADIPGFVIDQLDIPLSGGGTLTYTNVPIYVLDVAPELDGILGMNLFNYAASIVYDPFDPDGATLQLTYFEQVQQFGVGIGEEELVALSEFFPVLAGSLGGGRMPSFSIPGQPTLIVELGAAMLSEDAGASATSGTVTRLNSDLSNALVVTLVSNDTSEAVVPTEVTIGAGQASAMFTLGAVDDTLLDGDQTVTLTASAAGYASGTTTVTVADDDPDQIADDLIGRWRESGEWWLGQSNGSQFVNRSIGRWSAAATWDDVHVADVNADGHDDVVGRWRQTGQWWVGVSDGAVLSNRNCGTWSPSATWVDVRVGDFNSDGRDDIVGRWAQTGQWWVGLSTGSTFVNQLWGQWAPSATWVDVQVGDIDGDGRSDVFGRVQQTGQWWAAVSSGSGFANRFLGVWSMVPTWVDARVADMNGDGRADVIARWQQTGQWWAGISDGATFANQLLGVWSPAASWVDVRTGDVTGDGKADIVGRWSQAGQWWAGVSNGSSVTNQWFGNWSPSATWVDVRLADVNADGKSDIVGRWSQTGQWWVGASTGSQFNNQYWGTWSSAVQWSDVGFGDFDGGPGGSAAMQYAFVNEHLAQQASGGQIPSSNTFSSSSTVLVLDNESAVMQLLPADSEFDDSALERLRALDPHAIDQVFSGSRSRPRASGTEEPLDAWAAIVLI